MPAVAGLKRQGASRGAVVSFLTATPETGADSIPVTYALLDPLMTVIRPVAAFVTAITAGAMETRFGRPPAAPFPMAGPDPMLQRQPPLGQRLAEGLRFSAVDLVGDIGPYFAVGVLIAGAITVLLPEQWVAVYLGNPWLAMPAMLVISLPMYVCATASTPIAAALVLKGLNPGAALVFLLAGPATNAATISMVTAMMGRRSTAIYLSAIIGCSLLLGSVTDVVYGVLGTTPGASMATADELLPPPVKTAAAVALTIMIAPATGRRLRDKLTPQRRASAKNH